MTAKRAGSTLTDAEIDQMLTALFADPKGERVLRWMEAEWSVLAAPLIRQAIARERERWSTGGPLNRESPRQP